MERPGQLVTKRELLDAIWPETFVSETVLTNAVNQLRRALDDDPKQARLIETVHRRGYRWIGVVEGPRREARGASPVCLRSGAKQPADFVAAERRRTRGWSPAPPEEELVAR